MNGFTNTVLTMLLSWLKALISDLWSVLSGEGGNALYRFLAAHWKALLLLLCVGGVVADAIIYFFRWRPDYVWLHRPLDPARDVPPPEPVPSQNAPEEPSYATPSQAPTWQPSYAPSDATRPYQRVAQSYAPVVPAPYEDAEPLFDDAPDAWDAANPLFAPARDLNMPATFGAPQPEPLAYLRDMHAGFARPLPPEKMYAPAVEPQPVTPEPQPEAPFNAGSYAPVHPGLDADAFRQNFGLEQPDVPQPVPVMRAPAFHPFTMQREAEQEVKTPHPLARLARRARDLVGVDDDLHRRTIHDLQSTVDISTAFHEPVYPQGANPKGGEE